jgi:DNA-binding transcriptional LysR family regulator
MAEKWVFADGDTWNQHRLKLYFEQAGLSVPFARMESRNPAVLKSIVEASDFVTVIARLGVEKEVKAGVLKTVDLPSPLMQRPIGVVRRAGEPLSPAAKSFVKMAEDICRERYPVAA